MKQELPRPQGNIKQVIIKETPIGCMVKHYGNPELDEINAMLGVHAAAVFKGLLETFPGSEPAEIKRLILECIEFAIDALHGDLPEDDD